MKSSFPVWNSQRLVVVSLFTFPILSTQNFKQNALGSDQYLVKSGLSVYCLCMYEEISFGEKDFQIFEQTRKELLFSQSYVPWICAGAQFKHILLAYNTLMFRWQTYYKKNPKGLGDCGMTDSRNPVRIQSCGHAL